MYVGLEATLGGKNGAEFRGRADLGLSLSDLIDRLQGPKPGERWFEVETLPAGVTLESLAFRYWAPPPPAPPPALQQPSLFSIRSDIGVKVKDGPAFKLVFAFAKRDEDVLVGVSSRGRIDLSSIVASDTGIIGRFLGGLYLDRIGVYYASTQFDAIEGALFDQTDKDKLSFAKGPSFSARFGTAESVVDIALPPPEAQKQGAAPFAPQPEAFAPGPGAAVATRKAESGGPLRYWKDLDKTIGPLQLRRIGGEWDGKRFGILLDAAVSLAGLSVGLAGLCVKVEPSKLSKLKFEDLEFGLDGLELNFARGPVAISGALLKTFEGKRVGYAGQASIRAATFAIAAIGAYSTTEENQPAFFIFGAFVGILGGPPCFVVEGIAAGFGYNRAITLPDIDGVRDFPLVSIVLGKSEQSKTTALDQLGRNNCFPAVTGQYWIAAGVKFTSFKLVEAFALITVQFGARFEIALLGIATLRQPPAPAPRALVYIEMALKVRFAPDDGLLSVVAALTVNSFLFDTRCKLTGGFAFCIWFKPTNPQFQDRAGDFVVTLGGYHPRFQVPAHYPKVPRVGFNWQLPECGVTIKGEAYFALTPSFIMAGVRLSAVFRSGDFSAWFEAHADFLIGWAPLHYDAEVGVRIGAAFVLRLGSLSSTLSFELGALLHIWGPPFAGEAYVDLGIIAFTVPLGDRNAPKTAPKLGWEEFRGQFLPTMPLGVSIVAGLIEERTGANGYVIVNPSELRLAVESFVPITESNVAPGEKFTAVGVRPMGEKKLKSSLELKFFERPANKPPANREMVYHRTFKSAPEALWSGKPMPDAGKALEVNVIKDVLMGVQVLPAQCREFAREEVEVGIAPKEVTLAAWPTRRWEHAKYEEPGDRPKLFREAWGRPGAAAIEAMERAGFDLRDAVKLKETDRNPAGVWLTAPLLVPIGKLPPLPAGA
jgi:hypothetical protein